MRVSLALTLLAVVSLSVARTPARPPALPPLARNLQLTASGFDQAHARAAWESYLSGVRDRSCFPNVRPRALLLDAWRQTPDATLLFCREYFARAQLVPGDRTTRMVGFLTAVETIDPRGTLAELDHLFRHYDGPHPTTLHVRIIESLKSRYLRGDVELIVRAPELATVTLRAWMAHTHSPRAVIAGANLLLAYGHTLEEAELETLRPLLRPAEWRVYCRLNELRGSDATGPTFDRLRLLLATLLDRQPSPELRDLSSPAWDAAHSVIFPVLRDLELNRFQRRELRKLARRVVQDLPEGPELARVEGKERLHIGRLRQWKDNLHREVAP